MTSDCSSLSTLGHRDVRELAGISSFGFVIQNLRLHYLVPPDAFATMGVRLTYGEDWSQRLCRSRKLIESLLKAVPSASALGPSWNVEQWQAFGNAHSHWRTTLTACLECLQTGYHSLLFQMPWVNRCPWHDGPLTSRCPTCAAPLWKSIRPDASPLVCVCGMDFVDDRQLLQEPAKLINARTRHVGRYLKWARESRSQRDVFGLEQDLPLWEDAAMELFKTKLPWRHPSATVTEVLTRRSTVQHQAKITEKAEQANLIRIASDTGRAKDLFLELPISFELPMKRASRCVASKFPASSFSERERICLGIDGTSEYEEWQPRPSVVLLRAYSVKDKLYFDGRILSRPVQAILQQICLTMAQHTDSERLDDYMRAYGRVLFRGYATAAHHALAKIESPHTPPSAVACKPVVFVRRRWQRSRLDFLWFGDQPAGS